VVALEANLEKSVSRIRNVFHNGSLDVGCGIVIAVSAVDSDAFSVVDESTDEAVLDELRGKDATLLRESLSPVTSKTSSSRWVRKVVLDVLVAALSFLRKTLGFLSDGEARVAREVDDALFEKTLWGLIFVK